MIPERLVSIMFSKFRPVKHFYFYFSCSIDDIGVLDLTVNCMYRRFKDRERKHLLNEQFYKCAFLVMTNDCTQCSYMLVTVVH